MMKKVFLFAVAVLSIDVACSNDDNEKNVTGETEAQEQATEVKTLTEQQRTQMNSLSEFSLSLFRQASLQANGRSFVVSPIGTAFVLGMLHQSAEGLTASEIRTSLGMKDADRETVNRLFRAVMALTEKADTSVFLVYANNITLNSQRYTVNPAYEKALQQDYEASCIAADFANPHALQAVNGWSNEHSNGLVPEILDEICEDAVLYLLNAVCLKGQWTDPFDAKLTDGGLFNTSSDSREMRMMHRHATMAYAETDGMKALQLPMGNGAFSMTLLLPQNGTELTDFVPSLSSQQLASLSFAKEEVETTIPVFSTVTDNDLIKLLKTLGVNTVFDRNHSQLPYMVLEAENNLYVSRMLQKARIGIDEAGCEGAAVTLAEVKDGAESPSENASIKHFHANRPFVYYISERSTNAILFIGQFCGD